MFPVDLKLNYFQSCKWGLTPELFGRLSKSKRIVFHFLTFLWHGLLNYQTLAGAFYILFNRTDLVNKTCGFGIQYVTIWNLDILELLPNPKYDKIRSRLNTVLPYAYSSVVHPLSVLVTINFWSIYTHHPQIIDEDDVTKSFFPPWVNHGLHTTNLLLASAEMFVVYRPYPTRFWGFVGLSAVLLGYSFTCTILYFIGKVWPYPLIGMMSMWQRLLFVFGNCLLGCLIFIFGKHLNNKIWGNKAEKDNQKKLT